MSKLKNILFANNLPYLFILLWGGFFYLLNSFINSETESPLVCYSVSEIKDHPEDSTLYRKIIDEDELNETTTSLKKKHLRFEIINLSKNTLFDNLNIIICFRKAVNHLTPQRFFSKQITAISPAGIDSTGGFIRDDDQFDEGHSLRLAPYSIHGFQPENIYYLDFYTIYNKSIKEEPVPYVYSSSVVKFVKKGFREWLIIHRFWLNIILLTFLMMLAAGYTYWMLKNNSSPKIPYK